MSEVIAFPKEFDPGKKLLPGGYEGREEGPDKPFTLYDPTSYAIGEIDEVSMVPFAAAMNKANGDLAYLRYQFEFTQKAMALLLMAYVSRGSPVRLAEVEASALEAVVEVTSGDLRETAKTHLALVTAEMERG